MKKKKLRRMEVLAGLVKEHGWTSGAEIGVYKGATYFYLLDHCPGLKLIGVDSWRANDVPHTKDTTIGLSTWHSPKDMAQLCVTVMESAKHYPNATVYHADSLEVAPLIPDGSLDFVFVDGDHSTAQVLADLQAWSPKVRAGGMVLGHDSTWPSVQAARKQVFSEWREFDDSVWGVAT